MNIKNLCFQKHIGIPALFTVVLTGCYQDQIRSASEDDLLLAKDRATEEKLLHEFQSLAQTDPVAALDLNEPDPFELQEYPTHSIWPRVREGFEIETHLDHPWVQSELNWYSKHPEYLALFGEQAGSLAVYTHQHDHVHELDGGCDSCAYKPQDGISR